MFLSFFSNELRFTVIVKTQIQTYRRKTIHFETYLHRNFSLILISWTPISGILLTSSGTPCTDPTLVWLQGKPRVSTSVWPRASVGRWTPDYVSGIHVVSARPSSSHTRSSMFYSVVMIQVTSTLYRNKSPIDRNAVSFQRTFSSQLVTRGLFGVFWQSYEDILCLRSLPLWITEKPRSSALQVFRVSLVQI